MGCRFSRSESRPISAADLINQKYWNYTWNGVIRRGFDIGGKFVFVSVNGGSKNEFELLKLNDGQWMQVIGFKTSAQIVLDLNELPVLHISDGDFQRTILVENLEFCINVIPNVEITGQSLAGGLKQV